MAEVDPDDDTIRRFVVRRYVYDADRRERRDVVIAAYDNDLEMLKRIGEGAAETADLRRRGFAGNREHWTGVVKEPGYSARQAGDG